MNWVEILVIIFTSSALLFIIWLLPVYVIIAYFLWIACMMGWICIRGKKKISEFIVPISIMLLIFTVIYAIGYLESDLAGDLKDDISSILIPPVCSTLSFCYIGCKLAVFREQKKLAQMQIWIKSLNDSYQRKIQGVNKIITTIQNVYSNEKTIERLLNLIDSCSGTDLKQAFCKKVIGRNQEVMVQVKGIIKSILSEYSLSLEVLNKTLGEILDEMFMLKSEYKRNIYDENDIGIESYKDIKSKYNLYCCEKKYEKRNKGEKE